MPEITYAVTVTVDEEPKPSDIYEIMVGIRTALNIGKSEGIITHDSELLVERIEVESPTHSFVEAQGPVKIVDENGVYPNALDKAIEEQAAYYGKSKELIKKTFEHVGDMKDSEFAGYHQFLNHETGEKYGSFEVHYVDEVVETAGEPIQPGWYWRSCFPGCLPDGDDNGPFPTAEGAYLDAIGE